MDESHHLRAHICGVAQSDRPTRSVRTSSNATQGHANRRGTVNDASDETGARRNAEGIVGENSETARPMYVSGQRRKKLMAVGNGDSSGRRKKRCTREANECKIWRWTEVRQPTTVFETSVAKNQASSFTVNGRNSVRQSRPAHTERNTARNRLLFGCCYWHGTVVTGGTGFAGTRRTAHYHNSQAAMPRSALRSSRSSIWRRRKKTWLVFRSLK